MKKTAFLCVLFTVLLMSTGCTTSKSEQSIPTAQRGDTVKVNYTGKLDNGEIFDSSVGGEPIEFTVGDGQLISGFDQTVEGMEVNEIKTVTIPAQEAYGLYDDTLIEEVDRSLMPTDIPLQVGQKLQSQAPDGSTMIVTVVSFTDDKVTLDQNHPLAGKNLTFEIELVSIEE
jgi:peptidylprolyl isomerase